MRESRVAHPAICRYKAEFHARGAAQCRQGGHGVEGVSQHGSFGLFPAAKLRFSTDDMSRQQTALAVNCRLL